MKRISFSLAVLCVATMLVQGSASALTTSLGQSWNYAPDAWSRGTTADSAYFGWDNFEASGTNQVIKK